MPTPSEVRAPTGQRLTEALFKETLSAHSWKAGYRPLYTLKEEPTKEGLPSAYQIYMDSKTEYDAAIALVGSYSHWNHLLELSWFMDGIPDVGFYGVKAWREEKRAREASEGYKVIREHALTNKDLQAAKVLYQTNTTGDSPVGSKRGRPRKSDKEQQAGRHGNVSAIHARLVKK